MTSGLPSRSFDLHPRVLAHFRPARDFIPEQRAELGHGPASRHEPEAAQALANIGLLQDATHVSVYSIDDAARRACGRENRIPDDDAETGNAGVYARCNVPRDIETPRASHADPALPHSTILRQER